jgi:hypothetical protein
MMARQPTKALRPAFLGVLLSASALVVVIWYFFVRDTVVSETPLATTEKPLDIALLRSPAFQELVLPRGFPIEASVRFGRPNPFAVLAPVATTTPTAIVPSPALEIIPLSPFPALPGDAASATPFSL